MGVKDEEMNFIGRNFKTSSTLDSSNNCNSISEQAASRLYGTDGSIIINLLPIYCCYRAWAKKIFSLFLVKLAGYCVLRG
jgi:transcription elongation factor